MKNKTITIYQFENILEEMIDIEEIDSHKLLIITKKNRFILNNISNNIKKLCYEKLSNIVTPYVKSSNYKKVIWEDEEIELLKNNFDLKTIDELELLLNKSKFQINFMMSKLNLFVKKRWEKEEVEFLRQNLNQTTTWLAVELNRPLGSVKTQKRKMLANTSAKLKTS